MNGQACKRLQIYYLLTTEDTSYLSLVQLRKLLSDYRETRFLFNILFSNEESNSSK